MSRIANNPVAIPDGIEVNIVDSTVTVRGSKGELKQYVHPSVTVKQEDNTLVMGTKEDSKSAKALAGTTRALLQNIVTGVSAGYERKLQIIGVGYRAQLQGNVLNLTLGFSHPVNFQIPEGISIETPSQTEVVVKGIDKQKVGQVAANIRAYRPPEPYKGKGVRYFDEHVIRKETKKA
ncbi:MAG: 50S ribosomal protein L6 [Gammaproteobacteria bacterium]